MITMGDSNIPLFYIIKSMQQAILKYDRVRLKPSSCKKLNLPKNSDVLILYINNRRSAMRVEITVEEVKAPYRKRFISLNDIDKRLPIHRADMDGNIQLISMKNLSLIVL